MRRDERDVPLGAAFVAKEAVYEAWSARRRRARAREIRVTIAGTSFTAQIVASGEPLKGRVGRVGERWVAFVTAYNRCDLREDVDGIGGYLGVVNDRMPSAPSTHLRRSRLRDDAVR